MDQMLIVLLLIGLVSVPEAAQRDLLPAQRAMDSSITQIIRDYNTASGQEYLYRLFRAERPTVEPDGSVRATFSIRETFCLKSHDRRHDGCRFQPGRAPVICMAHISALGNAATSGHCRPAPHTRSNKRLSRRDLAADSSRDVGKTPETECLECLFTLLPPA